MKRIKFGESGFENTGFVISIGVFDGLHKGHQSIIKKNVQTAHFLKCRSMIINFDKNPKMTAGNMDKHNPLSTQRLDDEIFANIGVDYHCVIDFSDNISKLTGEEFLSVLSRFCIIRGMVVGKDFRCGEVHNSYGISQIDDYLKRTAACSVFEVVPDVLTSDGKVISSTSVRSCLLTGDLEMVSRLLGRKYTLDIQPDLPESGMLLFNKPFKTLQLLPPRGVWKVRVILGDGNSIQSEIEIWGDCLSLKTRIKGNIDRIEILGRSKNAYNGTETGNC